METDEEQEETGKKTFRENLQDVEYRRKFLHTLVLFASFLVLGLCDTIHFPAILDLAQITNTNIEQASVFYTSMSVGGLVGTMGMGFLFDKLPAYRSLLLAGANLGSAITITAIPWSTNYILTIFLFFICYVFNLAFDTGTHADLLSMWGSDGKMFMQFLHFSYALGSIISPLMVEPFLAEETSHNKTSCRENITRVTTSLHNVTLRSDIILGESLYKLDNISSTSHPLYEIKPDFSSPSDCQRPESRIHYAYIIAGSLCFITALVLVSEAFTKCINTKMIQQHEDDRKHTPRSRSHSILILILICILYLFMTAPGNTIPGYIMPFGVGERGWTKEKTAYFASIYWFVFAAARLLAVFVIKYMSAAKLLTICFLLLTISMGGLWISVAVDSEPLVWASIIASSGGFSVSFPTGFIYVEKDVMKVTGIVASMIMLATNGAGIVNPLILGYLMEEVSRRWYIYLTFAQVIVAFVVFIVLQVLIRTKKFSRKDELCISVEADALDTTQSNVDDQERFSSPPEEESLVIGSNSVV